MMSLSTFQQSNGSFNKINKEDQAKQKLAYLKTRRPIDQSRTADMIPNVREQIETNLKLLKFVADSQFTITQINGQRKLGPPPEWTGPPPSPKCEIFVGRIPRNYYEPEIVSVFSSVGKIYELRLMMEFSGINRGYCFIMYTTEQEAARAVRELDQYEICPGKKIGVVASLNNCRLYINQLPRNIDSESIIKRIYEMTDDIDKVSVYRSLNGFVFYVLVSYKTHRGAAMARRRLVPESMTLFENCEVNIEWAYANMSPSNVLEESGTCDEQGKVEITKSFIEPTKKIVSSFRQRALDIRSVINNQRSQKLASIPSPASRAIKCAKENSLKSQNNPTGQCKTEECKRSLSGNCSLVALSRNKCKGKENLGPSWDIRRNVNNGLDQSKQVQEHLKNYVHRDQSNTILPAISTYLMYLNKRKGLKGLKWNDSQRCSRESFRGMSFDDLHSVHNSSNSLTKCFPESLSIRNENDNTAHVRPIQNNVYKNEQILVENNVPQASNNFSNSHPLNEANCQFANCYQSTNYYQNFAINATKSNAAPWVQFPNQGSAHSLQDVHKLQSLSQQFSRNFHVNPVMINQNFNWSLPEFLPMEVYCCNSANIPDAYNTILNDCKYLNNCEVGNNSQQQNYGPFPSTVSSFDGKFGYVSPINPVNFALHPNDARTSSLPRD